MLVHTLYNVQVHTDHGKTGLAMLLLLNIVANHECWRHMEFSIWVGTNCDVWTDASYSKIEFYLKCKSRGVYFWAVLEWEPIVGTFHVCTIGIVGPKNVIFSMADDRDDRWNEFEYLYGCRSNHSEKEMSNRPAPYKDVECRVSSKLYEREMMSMPKKTTQYQLRNHECAEPRMIYGMSPFISFSYRASAPNAQIGQFS